MIMLCFDALPCLQCFCFFVECCDRTTHRRDKAKAKRLDILTVDWIPGGTLFDDSARGASVVFGNYLHP